MATFATPRHPTPVVLPYGDAYLARLAREYNRLAVYATVTHEQIDHRRSQLVAGLLERNLTRLDVDGLRILRVGRSGIDVA